MRVRVLVALALLVLSAAGRPHADTGIGFWTFEDVERVPVIPRCGPGVFIHGFAYDPQDRPVVGWNENNGCGGTSPSRWSRREAGAWNTRTLNPSLTYLGGAQSDHAHALSVSPSGTPFAMFRAVDASTGDNNVFTFLSNLETSPDAAVSMRKEFLVGPQHCTGGNHYMDFAPGGASPNWVSTLNLCGLGSGQMWLNGTKIANGVDNFNGADYATGPNGSHHIIRAAQGGAVFYSNGTDAGTFLRSINRFSGEVQIEVDDDGVIHATIGGVDSVNDHDLGRVIYITSSDGITWSAPESIGVPSAQSNVTLALDRNGVPAVAFWRFSELWYGTRASGTWEFSHVTTLSWNDDVKGHRRVMLDFDSSNRPTIAFFDWDATVDGYIGRVRLAHPQPAGAHVPIDIEVTVTHTPHLSAVGDRIVFTATASNRSARNASGVTLAVQQPTGVTHSVSRPIIGGTATAVHIPLGDITSFASKSVRIEMSGTSPGSMTMRASLQSPATDANPANNTAETTARVLDGACFVPRNDLSRWFRGEGSTLESISSIADPPIGGVSYTDGVYGQAFQFDGTSGRLETFSWEDAPEYPDDGSFTWQAWVKPTTGGTIAGKYEGSTFAFGLSYYFFSATPTRVSLSVRDSNGVPLSVFHDANVADGVFHHVAAVLDRATRELRFYLDGALVASRDASAIGRIGDDQSWRNSLVIGAAPGGNGNQPSAFFGGVIDEFALHKRALTAAEIEAIAGAPASVLCGGAPPPPSNTPPDAASQTVNATEDEPATITLVGTDADGDALTFAIASGPANGTLSGSGANLTYTPAPDFNGTDSFTFTVNDGTDTSTPGTVTIVVAPVYDPPPPPPLSVDCSAAAPSVSEIWPPNHKQTIPIDILGVTASDGSTPRVRITAVLQDEPTNTLGDGTTWIDGGGVGTAQAWVRAERSGTPKVPGNGRVYEILFSAAAGETATCGGRVFVSVPHDRGIKGAAVDDGVRYDSTVPGGARVR